MATRQQFIFNNKIVGITTIQFKNTAPLENVEKIVFFKEINLRGNWLKKEFRYSFDDAVWSSWRTFNEGNLTSIQFNDKARFYVEIIYTRTNFNSAKIDDIYLFYDSTINSPVDPPGDIIDANTLQGQPGSYYLDRSNFTGPYTGINVENVIDGSSAGVYYGRSDTSIGSTFYFKRIDGSGLIQVSEDSNGIITISGDPSIISGEAVYQNDNPTEEGFGGIPDGSTYFSTVKTFAEVMEDMFFPTNVPILTDPYNTLSNTNSLVTIGTTINVNLRSTLNRGSISPAYGTNGFRSGGGSGVSFQGPDVSIRIGANPSSPYNRSVNGYEVTKGYQTWTSHWDVLEGQQPLDSKGEDYDSPYLAQSLPNASTSFEGVYPVFATTSNITTLSQQPLVSMIDKDDIEIFMVAEPPFGTDRQTFDIASTWIQDSSILGIQTYNELDVWDYEGGTPATSLTKWTVTSAGSKLIGEHNVSYIRYTYNNTDRAGAVKIRLKFTL